MALIKSVITDVWPVHDESRPGQSSVMTENFVNAVDEINREDWRFTISILNQQLLKEAVEVITLTASRRLWLKYAKV